MFGIASTAFDSESEIPAKHTCEGTDVSPELEWTAGPEGTQSFAVIVDDLDAPDPNDPSLNVLDRHVAGHANLELTPAPARA